MGKRTPSKWLTLLAACFGLLMLYIDLFIVNVALPTIAQDFRAPLGTVSWTVSGYVLMIGVLPMGIGRLGDLWGQRVVYLAGVALFSIASLLCGLASSMTALIVFRVIQGIGAATHCLIWNLTLRSSRNTLSADHVCVFNPPTTSPNFPSPKRPKAPRMP